MMTLELDDEATRLLNQLMEREHIGAVQLVKQALAGYLVTQKAGNEEQQELMTDIIDHLPNLPTFVGDPLAIQKALRDEWR
jgi:predicted transcriptional regulator